MQRDKVEVKIKNHVIHNVKPPEERLQECFDKGSDFPFQLHNSILKYNRSVKQIIKQADIYVKEGDIEKAYILYIRYMTICLKKLETHPEYHTIPHKEKSETINTLKELFPKTEHIKKQLLEQFKQEHAKQKLEIERQERKAESLKQEELARLKEEEEKKKLEQEAAAAIPQFELATGGLAVAEKFGLRRQVTPTAPLLDELAQSSKDRLKQEDEEKKATVGVPHFGIAAGGLTLAEEYRLGKKVFPPKTFITPHYDELAQSSKDRKIPIVDRSTKPASLLSSTGDKLRDIIIPNKLIQTFLKLAYSNTSNNTETCGILAGRLERNKLLVTHFLIPKQTGSSDSCVTHNEEDIFDYQDQHDLITLGWIHTHPTQTAFLSSVDLHTHCAYQLMMDEAIAIVCAPKYDETGFFHLTPEFGLKYIANCRETGFHPHYPKQSELFTTAKHYKLDPLASIEAVDLRRK